MVAEILHFWCIKEEVRLIPSEMVKAAVLSTKKRAVKLVECQGEAFEGRKVRPDTLLG